MVCSKSMTKESLIKGPFTKMPFPLGSGMRQGCPFCIQHCISTSSQCNMTRKEIKAFGLER